MVWADLLKVIRACTVARGYSIDDLERVRIAVFSSLDAADYLGSLGHPHAREVKRMAKYSDEEIRNMSKITIRTGADYLGISPNMLTLGMRNDLLPIGFAVHNEDRYRDSWTYSIVPERLIAYNHGTINEIQVQNIEKNLNTIISQFEEMKRDLVFLLSEKEE